MEKIRWGILGCGKIANKFAADLKLVEGAMLMAVASRDAERSKAFADLYGAPLAFSSYEEMARSQDVDVIYIATPHGLHHEHAMLCIRHRKAVLCEKAFALNSTQVQEMIGAAQQHKVFLMEAFWTKFIPQYRQVDSIVSSGAIGEIRMVQADFGFLAAEPTPQRFFDPALGGGALLDIGIYPVFMATSLIGRPTRINALMNAYPSGVDKQIAMQFKYDNGALAVLSASFEAETPVEATIMGSKGFVRMQARFHNASSKVELTLGKEPAQVVDVHTEEGVGYQFEARHVTECLQQQLIESPIMKHSDSLLLMETLDRIREQCRITYPADR
ncbi:MAG: Gfo/Idh/MocA family oxidoreductase [Chryseolinea sp.]